jgi:UDP-glucose 4-epimerase
MFKAIVTGGCGFIGSHLVDHLLSQNFTVTVLDNFSTGRPENLLHQKENKNLSIVELDIAKHRDLLSEHIKNADFVYHLAALADIVPSVTHPELYYRANVQGTFHVLEACRQNPHLKKLIYAASSSCYGIPDHYPTPENADIRPEYPYALTKRLGEEMVMHWGKLYKIPSLSLRFFNVYGPRSRTSGTYGAVFGVFLAQKLAEKPFTVVGDGKQTRDFTFVTDVVEAIFKSSQSPVINEIFNVGSGNHYSVNLLTELLGGPKVYIPKRPGEPDCTFADISKIKNVLNWRPKISFENGVAEMIKSIEYWRHAPIWTPEGIEKETKAWFDALG